jgi:hypothetical protein
MGDSLTNLALVASNAIIGQLTLNVLNGQTYQIAVDSINSNNVVGSISINPINFDPPNDAFSNRTPMTGTNFSDLGYSGLASSEPGEPVRGIGKTLWWTWTAPTYGRAHFASSSPYALTSVFLGDTVSNLTLVTAGSASVDFTAVAGTSYELSVDSSIPNGAGNFSCSLNETPLSLNDNFANAALVSEFPATGTASNFGATLELGEPRFPDTDSTSTLWWKWTAPVSCRMRIYAQLLEDFENGDGYFGVYTGNSVSNLIPVVVGTNVGTFAASAGTT